MKRPGFIRARLADLIGWLALFGMGYVLASFGGFV